MTLHLFSRVYTNLSTLMTCCPLPMWLWGKGGCIHHCEWWYQWSGEGLGALYFPTMLSPSEGAKFWYVPCFGGIPVKRGTFVHVSVSTVHGDLKDAQRASISFTFISSNLSPTTLCVCRGQSCNSPNNCTIYSGPVMTPQPGGRVDNGVNPAYASLG